MPSEDWTSIYPATVTEPIGTDGLLRVEALLTHDLGWRLVIVVDTTGAEAEVRSLSFERVSDVDGGTRLRSAGSTLLSPAACPPTTLLRSVKMGEVAEAVNFWLRANGVDRRRRLPDPSKQRPFTARYWATWAAAYQRALEDHPRSPVAWLAEQHGLERGRVRDLIHQCRAKGYLTEGSRGRGGGQMTPKAIDELERKSR
jgi:hypothetical protein